MNKITRIDVIDNSVPGQAIIAFHDDDTKDRRVLARFEQGAYRFYPQYTDGGSIWHSWYGVTPLPELAPRYACDLETAMQLTQFSIHIDERAAS